MSKKYLVGCSRVDEALEAQFAKNVNIFKIGLTVIEKLRPKHDPKLTRLWELLQRLLSCMLC